MSVEQIIRAWTDAEYRSSLTSEQLSCLPPNPAGELPDVTWIAGGDGVDATLMPTKCLVCCGTKPTKAASRL